MLWLALLGVWLSGALGLSVQSPKFIFGKKAFPHPKIFQPHAFQPHAFQAFPHQFAFPHGLKPHAFFPKKPAPPKVTPEPTTTTTEAAPPSTTPKPKPLPKKRPHFFPPAHKPILQPKAFLPHALPFFPKALPHFPHAFLPKAVPLIPHKPKPTQPSEPEPTTIALDRSFCFDKKDGRYADPAVPCAQYFIYCTAGVGRQEDCPGGTYWDDEIQSCEYRQYVPSCGGSRIIVDPTDFPPFTTDTPPFAFSCEGKPDGAFENPLEACSPDYVVCSGGQNWFQSCQPGLFFDVLSTRCLPAAFVKWCGGSPTEIPAPNPPSVIPQPFEFSCHGLPDGQYEDPRNPCSSDYVSCVGEVPSFLRCYGNLKYDLLSDRCLSAIYVKWCGGSPTEPPTSPPVDVPQNPGIPFSCEGKPDGDYENPAEACSRFYFSCSGGVASFRYCFDDSLRYDVISGQCLAPEFVEWCPGGVATTPADIPIRDIPQAPFVLDCTDSADGIYDNPEDGCSQWYVACVGGSASYRQCPENLIFDWDTLTCIPAAYVAGCHGIPTPKPGPLAPKEPADFDCSGLPSGFYEDPAGCSDRYFSCNEGFPEALWCGGPLVYDAPSGRCLLPIYVASCHGSPTDIPEIPNNQAEEDPECAERGEGRYAAVEYACSPAYFICAAGNVRIEASCESGTFFDEDSSQCLHKRQVVACGGQKDPNLEPPANPNPPPKPHIHKPFLPKAPVILAPKAAPLILSPVKFVPQAPFFPHFSPKFLPHRFPH